MATYLSQIVDLIVYLITLILILQALMSFTSVEPWHPVRRFLDQVTEPILRPFRNLIPPVGMFDFSIMVALIVIQIVGYILKQMIHAAF